MNDKAYRVLEYNKIVQLLGNEAASQMTKDVISQLRPSVHLYQIEEMLAETTEAVSVIMRKGALPLGSFYDIGNYLYLAYKGSTLTMKQLLEILYNVQVTRNAARFLKNDLPELKIIREIADVLSIQKKLEEDIDRCIISEDEMADNASSKLKDVRRTIIRQNETIRVKMNQILNSASNRTLLQDTIVTMRQGRYVIPVKLEHRSKFPGIVHDQSATGATLFIEPQAIVNLNNELRQLELEEKIEMERILAELSASVADVHLELLNNQELLVKLDFIFAKGKLSVKEQGNPPTINDAGIIKIRQGRHPLIPKDKVVPMNIAMGDTYNTLVITGPNTGGKTVTLKTVGLFAMMTQSGLHIPVSDGTEMPIFNKIYADIGDEQSIEQSLSTFSSHMNNIVDIVKNTDEKTLVLLDELGAGTDPTEGAALAMAILENLYGKGSTTIATTHYTELKKYAISTYGVENASMEFNVETLSPTYKLTIGTPGRSNAFEISQKLGLPVEIIEHARAVLGEGDLKFEQVISAIEKDKLLAEEERDEAIALNLQMKKQKAELDMEKAKVEEQRDKYLSKAKGEAREIVREAKEFADTVQKELKELKDYDSSKEMNRRQEEIRSKIRKSASKYQEKIIIAENPDPIKADQLRIGDRVKILSLGQNGEVNSLPDDRNELQVQVGLLKMNVKIDNLMIIQGGQEKMKRSRSSSKYGNLYKSKAQNISISINVRGQILDDAIMDVDKYLDDAYMAGLGEVTVIHGRGEGVLREGIHSMLKNNKHVTQFRKGAYNEGGDGVTIVKLK